MPDILSQMRPPPSKPRVKVKAPPQPLWFTGFLVLLALVPLPFGANRPWAGDVFGLCTGILLVMCARDLYGNKAFWPAGAPWRRLAFSAIALLAVVVWGFLQTTSWFPPHPLWVDAAETLGTSLPGSVSLTPDRFSECALRILSYAACFLLAFFGCRDVTRAKILLRTLAFIAVGYALYGLAVQSSGFNTILWYRKWAYLGDLTSTFVNKNSYATYAGLGLLCCLAMLWRHIKKRPSLRLSLLAIEQIGAQDLYHAAMCLALFGALILTASRGGITSSLLGCFAFMAALALNQGWKGKKWLFILLPAAAFLIGFASFSTDMFLDRIDPKTLEENSMLRINAYATILRALGDNPLMGFGLGSFDDAFHLYRNAEIHEWFEHAHNDYLELAMELGIPAALLYIAAILSLISCCAEGIVHRRKQEIYCILAIGASTLVAMHSLVDFSMEIPAVAATYATILGLGVAQSWSSRDMTEN